MTSSPRYKWILVVIMLLISALNYGDRAALSAVFPMLRRDLGVTDMELGLVGSAFLWAYGLGCPFAGLRKRGLDALREAIVAAASS